MNTEGGGREEQLNNVGRIDTRNTMRRHDRRLLHVESIEARRGEAAKEQDDDFALKMEQ